MIQLVYVSEACRPFTLEDVEELLKVSRKHNARAHITGILFYKSGKILQLLEGEPRLVRRLFEVIQLDPRHQNVNLVYDHEVTARDFPDWSMAYQDLAASPKTISSDVGRWIEPDFDLLSIETKDAQTMLRSFIGRIS